MTLWKGLGAAVLLGAVLLLLGGRQASSKVRWVKARRGPVERVVSGSGLVQSSTLVKISSSLSGDLVELAVKEGDKVSPGQVLGKLDPRVFVAASKRAAAVRRAATAEVQLSRIDVERSRAELERVERLSGKGLASAAELERHRAEWDSALARMVSSQQRAAQASAEYEDAATNLTKTTLFSPIAGTVIEISREIGERVRGSEFSEDIVMTLADLDAMEVRIEVGERDVLHVRTGQRAEVVLAALENQRLEGTVVETAHKGTETRFPVTVALSRPPRGVLPGMSAEARIWAENRPNSILVPAEAVRQIDSEQGSELSVTGKTTGPVRVVSILDDQNRVHVRRVRTGIARGSELEVLEGIREGERIVIPRSARRWVGSLN